MSKNIIMTAQWGMQAELSGIWRICFAEEARPTGYFFNNMFQPQNCLVYMTEGRAAAMLHMLPARVAWNGRAVQAHYIYSAATLPEYRARGYMAALLNCAAYVGGQRGDAFSFLLPANRGLYDYYGTLGYFPYFELRSLTLSRQELADAARGGRAGRVLLTCGQINALRTRQLLPQSGSALWSEKMLCYADGINRLYGGTLVCALRDGASAYAFCRIPEKGVCEITEIMAARETLPHLAASLLSAVPAESYRLRLPNNSRLFAGRGKISRFGMIRPLRGITLQQTIQNSVRPYLGLTLD